jgi:hypothetical protein
MTNEYLILDDEEAKILKSLENNEWEDHPLSEDEKKVYKQYADYTLSLQEKKTTEIDFTIAELAFLMAKAKEIDVTVQNVVQTLVRNYAAGKIRLEL